MKYKTIIESNGSKWAGQEPNSIQDLINVLNSDYCLDPAFENYGNFYTPAENITFNKKTPPEYNGLSQFFGNFLKLSHGFIIYTNDPKVIESLNKAINNNKATPAYQEARKRLFLHGIEHLTKDSQGYVYWKGQQVEHYSFSGREKEEEKAAQELARRCRLLESRGKEVSTTNVIWQWDEDGDNNPYKIAFHDFPCLPENIKLIAWDFFMAKKIGGITDPAYIANILNSEIGNGEKNWQRKHKCYDERFEEETKGLDRNIPENIRRAAWRLYGVYPQKIVGSLEDVLYCLNNIIKNQK